MQTRIGRYTTPGSVANGSELSATVSHSSSTTPMSGIMKEDFSDEFQGEVDGADDARGAGWGRRGEDGKNKVEEEEDREKGTSDVEMGEPTSNEFNVTEEVRARASQWAAAFQTLIKGKTRSTKEVRLDQFSRYLGWWADGLNYAGLDISKQTSRRSRHCKRGRASECA
ncbi:hypothetical protein JAAARDRAFT_246711 [Jaapia argillacea MUCL 33604]|uniref:Uncharacterized protein n=1 Tax=Jaapia argillacea MUCL 33604 TaxID=933084 RepID=A0A067QDN4_9AGAM|nr:hypothetical protein JAAARDRAFT_246711 [Jaapia argillacea MUCL 33604]